MIESTLNAPVRPIYLRHFWLFEARVPHPPNAISPQISKFERSNNSADGRGKAFNTSWIIDYGLQITARDIQTGAICSAKCRFCEIGRDAYENDDGDRKRKRTERTNYYKIGSFRKYNIIRHLKQQHSKRWSEYQAKS